MWEKLRLSRLSTFHEESCPRSLSFQAFILVRHPALKSVNWMRLTAVMLTVCFTSI